MEHEKPLASENVISSLESGKWTISHHLTWSGSCPALVIQRDEQSMLPPASLKLPEMLKKGIFKTVIYSMSIYIVIRKVALNKAKHNFASIVFITNIIFDLWNEEMLFQSRFLSYFVGFTLAWRLFLSLSFPTFYSVHLCSCVNQPLRVEVCVFPSLSVCPSSSPALVARSCNYSSCVPMFLFLSGSLSVFVFLGFSLACLCSWPFCSRPFLLPAFRFFSSFAIPARLLFFNLTCIWVIFCKNITSISLTNVFVWLQASVKCSSVWDWHEHEDYIFNVQRF